jgi:signal transduction histidine kinase
MNTTTSAAANARVPLRARPPELDSGFDAPEISPGALARRANWIGWRLRLLVAAALLGCVGLFALAHALAALPHVDASWRADGAGRIMLAHTEDPLLRPLEGRALIGIVGAGASISLTDALALQRSARWIADDAERARYIALHEQLAAAFAQPVLRLLFANGELLEVRPLAQGYASLGALYWLLCATALLLYLVSMVALLVRPRAPSPLYAVMAWCQTGSLLFMAVEASQQLNLPSGFAPWEAQLRMALDLATGAAAVHAVALHPTRLPPARSVAWLAWGGSGALLALSLSGTLNNVWWHTQLAVIACGVLAMTLLTWSYRLEPHPFAVLLRRFGGVAIGSLTVLTIAVAASAERPLLQQGIAGGGAVIWYVLFAALLLFVPFLARSQQLMREFSLLAAISTVATSLDLLFVAVFSLGPFASLSLALFIALGAYAGARQWLLNRLLGSSVLTTERMFEQLYRIARDVELHPQHAPEQLSRLLRELFEPLEVRTIERPVSRTRILAQGSTLVVPVPDLAGAEAGERSVRAVLLRYARRGRHLFTREDARLTDRVVEQLGRAIAFDQAVERGRSEERARLAQDLHDDIGARLLTLMYKATTPEMEDYVRHTLQDLKTLTRGLAAPSHPLSHAAAEWKADLVQRLSVAHIELAWSLHYDDDLLLSVVQWSALTRVLRELVSNAIAHAQATRLAIDFNLQRDRLELLVSDNGIGRTPRVWAHGLGLGGVRKRVKQLGGEVEWIELAPRGIACRVSIRGLSKRR